MKIKPDQNAVTMIQELSDAKAPSGFEDEAVAVAKKYGAEFADDQPVLVDRVVVQDVVLFELCRVVHEIVVDRVIPHRNIGV